MSAALTLIIIVVAYQIVNTFIKKKKKGGGEPIRFSLLFNDPSPKYHEENLNFSRCVFKAFGNTMYLFI